ncbi:hypothetical protein MPTK1_1g29580 [Marchantia polymorpha subsp. ruderalis]|uniref:Uncharacterized protein n=2 Tax=Marchantia polymorpha TaxID=3197 RepID=A0AAF6AVL9_MARPO|nr:hypothetical protein MARPO_0139s0017 [Marchantia polymorpha]BBN00490.1 hypothetical protein Mp_1g29580 [Marchantia polymorpha subsp. ruderalis]|eukprot:PTQ29541.1 hypothetical protein MARPO_0139s0017 [Marchantia polymorpha]
MSPREKYLLLKFTLEALWILPVPKVPDGGTVLVERQDRLFAEVNILHEIERNSVRICEYRLTIPEWASQPLVGSHELHSSRSRILRLIRVFSSD